MKPRISALILFLAFMQADSLILPVYGQPDVQQPEQEDIVNRIVESLKRGKDSGDWKKEQWLYDHVEAPVRTFAKAISKAARIPPIEVPVEIELTQVLDGKPNPKKPGIVFAGDDELTPPSHSIVIGDEVVRIRRAEHCLIVCRGAVTIDRSLGNIVVAGHYAGIDREGGEPESDEGEADDKAVEAAPRRSRSLIVAGGFVSIRSAHGSVVSSGSAVKLASSSDAIIVGDAKYQVRFGPRYSVVRDEESIPPIAASDSIVLPEGYRAALAGDSDDRRTLHVFTPTGRLDFRRSAAFEVPNIFPANEGLRVRHIFSDYALLKQKNKLFGLLVYPVSTMP